MMGCWLGGLCSAMIPWGGLLHNGVAISFCWVVMGQGYGIISFVDLTRHFILYNIILNIARNNVIKIFKGLLVDIVFASSNTQALSQIHQNTIKLMFDTSSKEHSYHITMERFCDLHSTNDDVVLNKIIHRGVQQMANRMKSMCQMS